MKQKKIAIISILIVALITLLWRLNKNTLLLWNANSIHVNVEEPLSKEKVQVRFGVRANARYRDEGYFENKDKYTILYDGKTTNDLINEYGENDFLLIYDNRYYLPFRQFKTNRRHQHDYYFHFYQRHDSIFVQVSIKGVNKRNFECPLIDSKRADSVYISSNWEIDNLKLGTSTINDFREFQQTKRLTFKESRTGSLACGNESPRYGSTIDYENDSLGLKFTFRSEWIENTPKKEEVFDEVLTSYSKLKLFNGLTMQASKQQVIDSFGTAHMNSTNVNAFGYVFNNNVQVTFGFDKDDKLSWVAIRRQEG